MKNKKLNKESILEPNNSKEENIADSSINSQTTASKTKNEKSNNSEPNKTQLVGLNDKFPVENFVSLFSTQKSKKIKLQTYKYPAKSNSQDFKGLVYLIHGLYEHANSNANIAKILSEQGYEVLSFDLRGHGKSEGIRGYLENKDVIVEDIRNFIKITENEYPEDKLKNKFVFGYSFGALFANLISLEKKDYFNGMVLLAPPFYMENKYNFWIKIANILKFFFPTLPLVKIKGK
jgi:alpha-beta hydrolase superfamily lysophospholipase